MDCFFYRTVSISDFSTSPVSLARNDSSGKFTAAFVKMDHCEHLALDLRPKIFQLTEDKS